jgi:hypothetical protein
MVDNNSANDDTNNAKDGDKTCKYYDGLLRLVEEKDKDGGINHCVECATTGDLLYSSNSKPQAYSFCEGYRARDEAGDTPSGKAKADDNSQTDSTAKPTKTVDPANVQRKRMVL